ncbi:MAG: tetratricopeptide repeat protein [Rhodanobacteraceae bacterium]
MHRVRYRQTLRATEAGRLPAGTGHNVASLRGFFAQLRRRNVLRAGALYIAGVWALGQGLSQFSPALGLPDATTRWFLIAAALAFPLWLASAWFYEFTPRGFKRESEVASDAPLHQSNARLLDFAIIGVLALAVALLLANQLVWHKGAGLQSAAATAVPAKSIAVLPFENLSNDKANEYFVAGMQDLILTKLADIGGLKVISRTSTEQYQSHPRNLRTIAGQLGVATLLEGSVQKAGDQVLINVQLIDAANDQHIWAQSYQRTLDNVFGVEGDVAEKIAAALKTKLSPDVSQRLVTALSSDRTANDLFLRAEYYANRGQINTDTAAWKQAIPLYRQAIQHAPDFALACARLSYVESNLAWFGGGGENVQQLRTDAQTQAERALALQPDLPEAHLAIGFSDYWGRSDYAGALTAFAAALKARPNDAGALEARGFVLRRQGNFDTAIEALQQALARDPRNTELSFELGVTYMMISRYTEAEAALQHALALDPGNINAKFQYSQTILFASGDVARALSAAQGDDPQLQLQRVSLLEYQREYRAAATLLASISDTADNFSFLNGPKSLQQGDLQRLLGDAARAGALYAKALPLARAQLEAQAGLAINEATAWRSVADAELGLGHVAAGLAAIARSREFLTRSDDRVYGSGLMESNAGLYARANRPDLAVPLLAQALATPGIGFNYSPVLLWIDPAWDPIRRDPGFRALLKQYAKYKPATAAARAPVARASAVVNGD